ncbi:MAG: hypothetical protein P8Y63_07660 [Deltaproteobacteria bacterium]|jgi:polyhydroxyalkanoate synthesis regulator phasin
MIELIQKGLLASLGIAFVTRDKVLEATRELVEKGKLSRAEAETLVNELVGEGRRQQKELEVKVDELLRQGLDRLDIGSKRAFADLEQRLDNVEKRLTMVEDRLGPATSE